MWYRIHTELQRICIRLWSGAADCRNLVAEAGIDSSQMVFDEPPALRWESVIIQCENQRSLDLLCPVLLARYPKNPVLQAAVAPWIHGNPPEVNGGDVPEVIEKPTTAETPESTSIVTETPTTTTTTTHTKKIPGTNVEEAELVPVVVPKEFSDVASVALVATIPSLRLTVAELQRQVDELIAWRGELSRLSRAEVAVEVRGNEPGPNDPIGGVIP